MAGDDLALAVLGGHEDHEAVAAEGALEQGLAARGDEAVEPPGAVARGHVGHERGQGAAGGAAQPLALEQEEALAGGPGVARGGASHRALPGRR